MCSAEVLKPWLITGREIAFVLVALLGKKDKGIKKRVEGFYSYLVWMSKFTVPLVPVFALTSKVSL